MGLFDGKSGGGELASTAHVAKLLDAPVVLVVDARAMARSVAAMVHGYATFDPDVERCWRRPQPRRLERPREDAPRRPETRCGIPVLGVLRRDDAIQTPDRHLGLVPAAERRRGGSTFARRPGRRNLRLSKPRRGVEACPFGRNAERRALEPRVCRQVELTGNVRVAVAAGPSFSFLYRENLELLEAAGAEVVAFDPTSRRGPARRNGRPVPWRRLPGDVRRSSLRQRRHARERARLRGERASGRRRVRRAVVPGP